MTKTLSNKLWVTPTLRRLSPTKELRELFEREVAKGLEKSERELS